MRLKTKITSRSRPSQLCFLRVFKSIYWKIGPNRVAHSLETSVNSYFFGGYGLEQIASHEKRSFPRLLPHYQNIGNKQHSASGFLLLGRGRTESNSSKSNKCKINDLQIYNCLIYKLHYYFGWLMDQHQNALSFYEQTLP